MEPGTVRLVCDSRKHNRNVRLDAYLAIVPDPHSKLEYFELQGPEVEVFDFGPIWEVGDFEEVDITGYDETYKVSCHRCHAAASITFDRLQIVAGSWAGVPVVKLSELRSKC